MSEKDDESLIGYDPLAWLNQGQQDENASTEADTPFDEAEPQAPEEVSGEEAISADAISDHSESGQKQQIVLESVQNIQNVAQLHERVLDSLNKANQIDIDASAVTTIDTSSLQLLLVLKQAAVKMQKEVNIDFPSDKFIEAAELLGLAEMLDVDQAASGFF